MTEETWMQYLSRTGVFSVVELCHKCNRRPGTVQMYGGIRGKKVPIYKYCGDCHLHWLNHAQLRAR